MKNKPKPEDFYDPQDPRGMSSSEHDKYMNALSKCEKMNINQIDTQLVSTQNQADKSFKLCNERNSLPGLIYSDELIDLSKRPQPIRWGSYAPIILYNFDEGKMCMGMAGGKGWLFDGNPFEPTHAMFVPYYDYRK